MLDAEFEEIKDKDKEAGNRIKGGSAPAVNDRVRRVARSHPAFAHVERHVEA